MEPEDKRQEFENSSDTAGKACGENIILKHNMVVVRLIKIGIKPCTEGGLCEKMRFIYYYGDVFII